MFLKDSSSDTVKPSDIVSAMKKNQYDLLKPSIFKVSGIVLFWSDHLQLFDSINTPEHNETGITFEYFIDYLIQSYNSNEREALKKRFELFDFESKGYIDFERIIQISDELGVGLLKEEALLMFERASSDKEKITFDDFYFTMTQNTSAQNKPSHQDNEAINNTTSFSNNIFPQQF